MQSDKCIIAFVVKSDLQSNYLHSSICSYVSTQNGKAYAYSVPVTIITQCHYLPLVAKFQYSIYNILTVSYQIPIASTFSLSNTSFGEI